jgi:hypothetical protein
MPSFLARDSLSFGMHDGDSLAASLIPSLRALVLSTLVSTGALIPLCTQSAFLSPARGASNSSLYVTAPSHRTPRCYTLSALATPDPRASFISDAYSGPLSTSQRATPLSAPLPICAVRKISLSSSCAPQRLLSFLQSDLPVLSSCPMTLCTSFASATFPV